MNKLGLSLSPCNSCGPTACLSGIVGYFCFPDKSDSPISLRQQAGRNGACPPKTDAKKRYFDRSLEVLMSRKNTRRSYTDDFKSQAAALSDSIGRAEAARQLGIPVKSLANWVTAANAGRPLRSPKRKPVDELESEPSRLSRRLQPLREWSHEHYQQEVIEIFA